MAKRRSSSLIVAAAVLAGAGFCGFLAAGAMARTSPPAAAQATPYAAKNATALANRAYFLYKHRHYHQALKEVNAALKADPNFQNAHLIKALIKKKLKHPHGKKKPRRFTRPQSKKLLTMEDVYRIRLAEFRVRHFRGQLTGHIVGGRTTLRRFWKRVLMRDPRYQNHRPSRREYRYFMNPRHFREQVRLIKRLAPQKYRDKVQLTTDPPDMRMYREKVQPFFLQSCATVGCHRGQDSHGLRLYGARHGANILDTYTNFYTLSKLHYKKAAMINRAHPRKSLFLQYTLSPEVARFHHPGKKGPTDHVINARAMLAWIKSLYYPTPSYGIAAAPRHGGKHAPRRRSATHTRRRTRRRTHRRARTGNGGMGR